MAADNSKAVLGFARRKDNGKVFAYDRLGRTHDYLPHQSAQDYLKGAWDGAHIPWGEEEIAEGADMAGFGTNMSQLAGQVQALCTLFGIEVDDRGAVLNPGSRS